MPWLLLALLGSVFYQRASTLAAEDRKAAKKHGEGQSGAERAPPGASSRAPNAAAKTTTVAVLALVALALAGLRATQTTLSDSAPRATFVSRAPPPAIADADVRAGGRRADEAEALAEDAVDFVVQLKRERDEARGMLRGGARRLFRAPSARRRP